MTDMNTQVQVTSTLGEAIVEHIAEAVIYANRNGAIERWNTAAAQMFGFSAAEAIGRSLDLMWT
ncbi:MAG: PAS domain-containing protein [Caldimonas sp.]